MTPGTSRRGIDSNRPFGLWSRRVDQDAVVSKCELGVTFDTNDYADRAMTLSGQAHGNLERARLDLFGGLRQLRANRLVVALGG